MPVLHAVLNYGGPHVNSLRARYEGFDDLIAAYKQDFGNRGLNRSNIYLTGRSLYASPSLQEMLLCPIGFNPNGQSRVVRQLWDDFEAWVNVQRAAQR